ncbi:MgtC/SapB family protein [Salsuginibacillus kocurii]|uniref:MgtC/SapB family protein n=1 Tax=Salsuginibacillus kocurii TaxID=427078 RepID=UPI000379C034|nr:MgtC/SapB family protein [Salsuginibacillus kocurii]
MEEFFSTNEYAIMFTRLILAASLAGAIGIEREYKDHPAGFRTHLLVGLGACLVMLMAMFGFESYMEANPDVVAYDPSRLAAYVISGVGFLGAGTIIVQGVSVRGLTTAASIWVVAGIGLATGAGMYFAAILTTFIVLLSLFFLNRIDQLFKKPQRLEEVNVVLHEQEGKLHYIISELEHVGVAIVKIRAESQRRQEEGKNSYHIEIKRPDSVEPGIIYERLQKQDGVIETQITKPSRIKV